MTMSMKIIIISDSHGNVANLKLVAGFAKKIKAGAIIHCGDWDNLKSVEEIYSYKIPVCGVLGNADIDPRIAKIVNDQWLKVNLGGRKIGIIHDFKHFSLDIRSLDILFCGHRHLKSEGIINGVKVVSPGALHSVKPSFAVYETDTNRVEFFDLIYK